MFQINCEYVTVSFKYETFNGGRWIFQVVKPVRQDCVFGVMDDFGNFQEVLWGRAILRAPGAWW